MVKNDRDINLTDQADDKLILIEQTLIENIAGGIVQDSLAICGPICEPGLCEPVCGGVCFAM